MKLTTKRLLILFSIFLNIGFVTAAAHHALFFDPIQEKREAILEEIDRLKVPESKRTTLVRIEGRFHEQMRRHFQQRRSIMDRRLEILTGLETPDPATLDALREEQLEHTAQRIDGVTAMLMEMREEIGPERTREFIDNVRALRHKKHP